MDGPGSAWIYRANMNEMARGLADELHRMFLGFPFPVFTQFPAELELN